MWRICKVPRREQKHARAHCLLLATTHNWHPQSLRCKIQGWRQRLCLFFRQGLTVCPGWLAGFQLLGSSDSLTLASWGTRIIDVHVLILRLWYWYEQSQNCISRAWIQRGEKFVTTWQCTTCGNFQLQMNEWVQLTKRTFLSVGWLIFALIKFLPCFSE